MKMKNKHIYIQDDSNSCGARCIQSIVSFYGGYVPLELAMEDTNTGLSGTTALDLVNALKKYGFDAYGIKTNIEKIDKNRLPVIAHVIKSGYEHFVVIYDITKDSVLTMDPEYGKKIYNMEDFQSIFSGNLLFATPVGKIPKFKKSKSLIKTFTPLIYTSKAKILIVSLLSVILILFNILISFHLKILSQEFMNPIKITSFFIILQIIISLITLLKEVFIERMTNYIDEKSLSKFTKHIFNLPIRYLSNKRVGEIVKKIEDMTFIKNILIRITFINVIDVISLLVTLPLLFMLSRKLTIIYSIILILYTMITILTQKKIYKNEKNYFKTYNDYSGTLTEYLAGIESIKNLNASDTFLEELNNSFYAHTKTRLKGRINASSFKLLKALVFEIGLLAINLIGFMSLSESFSFLDLLTYQSLFSLAYISFESLILTYEDFLKGKAIFRNVCEFNDVSEERLLHYYDLPFTNMLISHLSFSYDRLHYTIKDFSYCLRKGEKLLLSGPSGIGKSTLVKCISGRIDNYEGNIYLNCRNINTIGISCLRNYIVYISQEETLFRKSIYDNVTFGIDNKELFNSISRLTLLDEVISSKMDKENTMLMENASNLSGGEKARLVLARALFKQPDLLIIDETLSSINEEMEDIILNNLLSIPDLSLIYITHRDKEKFFENIIKFRKDGTYDFK